jgi:hypothetical protein
VWIHLEGEDQVTYFYDVSGTQILRELDYSPAFKFTLYSPVEEGGTGVSFTYPSTVQLHVDYPQGTTVGSPAIITVTGLSGFAAPGVAGAGVAPGARTAPPQLARPRASAAAPSVASARRRLTVTPGMSSSFRLAAPGAARFGPRADHPLIPLITMPWIK